MVWVFFPESPGYNRLQSIHTTGSPKNVTCCSARRVMESVLVSSWKCHVCFHGLCSDSMSLDAKSFCSSVDQNSEITNRISQPQHFLTRTALVFSVGPSLCWWVPTPQDWNANPFLEAPRVELTGTNVDSLPFHCQYMPIYQFQINFWRRKAKAILPLLSCYGMHESRKGSNGIKTCRPCSTNNVSKCKQVNSHNTPSYILEMYPNISYDRYHVMSLVTSYGSRIIHINTYHITSWHMLSCHIMSRGITVYYQFQVVAFSYSQASMLLAILQSTKHCIPVLALQWSLHSIRFGVLSASLQHNPRHKNTSN